jgi:L-ribulose-5-phosphate 3-epimerase
MNRRDLIRTGSLVVAGAAVFGASELWASGKSNNGLGARGSNPGFAGKENMKLPFKLSVITDEISQDFGHAAEIASKEFGLGYIEIRTLWKKNIVNLDGKELAEVRRIVDKYQLQVTDIGSPLFKIAWPGAPKSKYDEGAQYGADFTFDQQDEVLERAIAAGKKLGTTRVRCFDFWRLDDPKPYRQAIDERLLQAATKAGKDGVTLLLENEFACNTATGGESARTIQAVQSPHFLLNWDPGNAAYRGEVAFPDGYAPIPKQRIGHMHLKDVKRGANGNFEWEAMGRGIIDYAGQFRALAKDGYSGTMSLETHWTGAGSQEESSRQSMAGTKELLRKALAA